LHCFHFIFIDEIKTKREEGHVRVYIYVI